MRLGIAALAATALVMAACAGPSTITPPADNGAPVPEAVQAPPEQQQTATGGERTARDADADDAGTAAAAPGSELPASAAAEEPVRAQDAYPAAAEPATAQDSSSGDASTPEGADTAEPESAATADPTIQALAASFEFPLRGDPAAPLRIYEFTDFL